MRKEELADLIIRSYIDGIKTMIASVKLLIESTENSYEALSEEMKKQFLNKFKENL